MEKSLPRTCFISHAYRDGHICKRLRATLPEGVASVVYSPITVPPDQLVSTLLINALLSCDGLIYLNGGASASSFWVAFERDYALRAGKEVYAADVTTLAMTRHTGAPLDLATFPSYLHADSHHVGDILKFLSQERHFDLPNDCEQSQTDTSIPQTLRQSLSERLMKRGGYAIAFWSRAASRSPWVDFEVRQAAEGMSDFNDRVLFACLDPTPLPDFWLRFQEPAVQLWAAVDEDRSATQRRDDLVVRLYWLIYRKTEMRQLEILHT